MKKRVYRLKSNKMRTIRILVIWNIRIRMNILGNVIKTLTIFKAILTKWNEKIKKIKKTNMIQIFRMILKHKVLCNHKRGAYRKIQLFKSKTIKSFKSNLIIELNRKPFVF